MLASLAQTLIKVTAPGVPDFYQGAETWHRALVDPDNRTPIDFDAAGRAWDTLSSRVSCPDPDYVRALVDEPADGRVKLFVTAAALQYRRRQADLFAHGRYIPLTVDGGDDLFAFARAAGRAVAITLVARPSAKYGGAFGPAPDAVLHPPADGPTRWRDVLTGSRFGTGTGGLRAADVLAVLPCALLVPGD
jgi:(1->4)-alpha-D-glucan 1-alpha-D-glucosylmutase